MKPKWDEEPAYPGASIAEITLRKGDELGLVAIQHYGSKLLIAAYLPGGSVVLPGDTPKTRPDRSIWVMPENRLGAETVFDQYVRDARDQGWVDYVRP